ncbi:MAG: helix-turn-helix transcriptional regulator [Ruminococcaceae bacterium]|nr:helix-turn-helix transcriptional regulator [Oscillospiraceae bacterium]
MIEKSETLIKTADYLDIKLRDHGHAVLHKGWYYPKTALPMSRLYFSKTDGGILEYSDTIINIKAGKVYLIPANFKFGYTVGENGWEKLFVHFGILRSDGYDLLSGIPRIYEMELGVQEIDTLITMYNSNDTRNSFAFKCRIYETVAEMLRRENFVPRSDITHSELIRTAIEYIRSHLSIKLSISEIAAECFISESLLSKRFREECGITLGKYIDDLVFFSAQNMLIGTNMSISRISEKLGFCDQFYFSRRFRQFAGISPRYYRKYRY